MDNANKGGWKVSKHVELWGKNIFGEWGVCCGFDTKKSIIDFLGNEDYVKHLVSMFLYFVMQVAKNMAIYIF
jgi:hypothetical protein